MSWTTQIQVFALMVLSVVLIGFGVNKLEKHLKDVFLEEKED